MSEDEQENQAQPVGASAEPTSDSTPRPVRRVATLQVNLTHVNLGPSYPPAAVSAEIGRVAIAAARVDEGYALLLSALHAGDRATWDLDELRKLMSAKLRDKCLARVEEFFEGELLDYSKAVITDAYKALDARHRVMHSVWSLRGEDAMTPATAVIEAMESEDPDAALAALVGQDVESPDWRTLHPKSGAPGPQSLVDLRTIRSDLEAALAQLNELRFSLASALYTGGPSGAKRVIDIGI